MSKCPWPKRYTIIDEKATEQEVIDLVAGFVRALQPDYVIETGTYKGDMANAIGRALKRNGQGWLDTIEIDPDLAQEARRRLNRSQLPVEVHTADSTLFIPNARPQFVWFDSGFDSRIQEFFSFIPYLDRGAIVGFHDTDDRFPMGEFVETLCEEGYIRAISIPTHRGVMFGEILFNGEEEENSD